LEINFAIGIYVFAEYYDTISWKRNIEIQRQFITKLVSSIKYFRDVKIFLVSKSHIAVVKFIANNTNIRL